MTMEALWSEASRQYMNNTSRSQQAYMAAEKVMPGGDTRTVSHFAPYPLTIERGQGAHVYDLDGHRYIDFLNNYTSMIHGHVHPHIVHAVQEVLQRGFSFASGLREQTKLAEMICERLPGIERIRFCNSGTEASMFALRAARAFAGKPAIVKMIGGYHGTYDDIDFATEPWLMKVKGEEAACVRGIPGSVNERVYRVPFNDADVVERLLRDKAEEIACVIVEPVLGAGGVIPPASGYLQQLRQVTERHGVLLVFDEVQTLRLDVGGAQTKYRVIPDLTVLGKIIGGGLPIGAFGGRADIMQLFDPANGGALSHTGTFNGNLASMRAGIASLELLDESAILRLERLGEKLATGMKKAIRQADVPAVVTRAGSLLQLHFGEHAPKRYVDISEKEKKLFALVHLKLLNRGVYTSPRGMWNLSTVMTDNEIDTAIQVFAEVMDEIADAAQSVLSQGH